MMRRFLVAFVAAILSASLLSAAECECSVIHTPAVKQAYWRKSESPNFIIHTPSDEAARAKIAQSCEQLRQDLSSKWFGDPLDAWKLKCHVVLHRTKGSYQQAVGNAVANTSGSTWIEFDKRDGTRITLRRIDLLCDKNTDDLAALPHELTHALLADWFSGKQPPRWLDEGMAVLADTKAKQSLHLRDLRAAYFNRTSYRVVELLQLEDHPRQDRIPAFYGQSLALVQLLIERDSPDKLLKFVDRSQTIGHDAAVREVYGIDGVAELEKLWQSHYDALASN